MPKTTTQPSTAQSLGALLKSARGIMRKDKGLNGDLDRLPMLTFHSSLRQEALVNFGFLVFQNEPRPLGCDHHQDESNSMICP